MSNHVNEIAYRIRRLRQAVAPNQATLCRRIRCAANRWNQYESGTRVLTLEIANRLCDEYGVTLDWIYRGDPSGMPVSVLDKLEHLPIAAE